jgi:hypothetical protein
MRPPPAWQQKSDGLELFGLEREALIRDVYIYICQFSPHTASPTNKSTIYNK